jgi:hypothetical protein
MACEGRRSDAMLAGVHFGLSYQTRLAAVALRCWLCVSPGLDGDRCR